MLWRALQFSLMLFVLSATVLAAVGDVSTVDVSNRFLSAEVQRQFDAQTQELTAKLQENQDANFRALDERMNTLMSDIKMKSIIGVIGAALAANAIIAILMLRQIRKYSFEKYQEDLLGKQQAQLDEFAQYKQMVELAGSQTWNVQQPQETISMAIGQSAASQHSQMNAWQTQPAHKDAWVSPVKSQHIGDVAPVAEPPAVIEVEEPGAMPEWQRAWLESTGGGA